MNYKRAVNIYREEGFTSLVSSIQSYFFNRYEIQEKFYKSKLATTEFKSYQIKDTNIVVPLKKEYQIERFCTIHNEKTMIEDMVNEINKNEIIYDVGAYIGWHTLTAASVASEGTTIAFEPHPKSYNRLTEVVDAAAEGDTQLYNLALSNENGRNKISEQSSASARLLDKDQCGIGIKIVAGDEFIKQEKIPLPTTIKIDVEGKEVNVLEGLKKTISRPECRLIYCELHPETAPEGEEVNNVIREVLEQHGFEIQILQHNSKEIIKAVK